MHCSVLVIDICTSMHCSCVPNCNFLQFPNYCACLSLMIVFNLTNSTEPDEKLLCMTFHFSFRCLSRYPFMDLQNKKEWLKDKDFTI